MIYHVLPTFSFIFLHIDFFPKKAVSRADAKLIVNIRADAGSHVTAPVLTSNVITGNANIHNASGKTYYLHLVSYVNTACLYHKGFRFIVLVCCTIH